MKKVVAAALSIVMVLFSAINAGAFVYSEDGMATYQKTSGKRLDFETPSDSVVAIDQATIDYSTDYASDGTHSLKVTFTQWSDGFAVGDLVSLTSADVGKTYKLMFKALVKESDWTAFGKPSYRTYLYNSETGARSPQSLKKMAAPDVSDDTEFLEANNSDKAGNWEKWLQCSREVVITQEMVEAGYDGIYLVQNRESSPTLRQKAMYIDEFGLMMSDEVTEQVDWLSLENFEGDTKYEGKTDPNNHLQSCGSGGTSLTGGISKGVRSIGDAHSPVSVASISGRGHANKKSNGAEIPEASQNGNSNGLKMYGMFGLDQFTPTKSESTWEHGWEMFTEEDIGRVFRITAWVYAPSSDGAVPYNVADTYFENGKSVVIEIDDSKRDTVLPFVNMGLMGPSSSTENDAENYKYATVPYQYTAKDLQWDTWTKFELDYEVTADTIYGQDQDGKNTLVNAIRFCSGFDEFPGTKREYMPVSFYVDDVSVVELASYSQTATGIDAEVYLDSENAEDVTAIAALYDAQTNALAATDVLSYTGTDRYTFQFDVDNAKQYDIKVFLWNGKTMVPQTKAFSASVVLK